ncbi:hypothetical protein LINPERHAP1_LOCUS4357 [Linum perenne]
MASQKEREGRILGRCLIKQLAARISGPLCVLGDFNNILNASEQRGRNPRPQFFIAGFRDVVAASNLVNIQLDGYPFTWSRAKDQPHGIEFRLDRALANPDWFMTYQSVKLRNQFLIILRSFLIPFGSGLKERNIVFISKINGKKKQTLCLLLLILGESTTTIPLSLGCLVPPILLNYGVVTWLGSFAVILKARKTG